MIKDILLKIMRKKTVKCIADEIFWLVLSFLPVIGYLIYLLAFGQNPWYVSITDKNVSLSATVLSFGSFMSYSGFYSNGGIVYNIFVQVLGNGGVLPLMNNDLCRFFSYFVTIQLVHLLVDIVLFIVRIAHKWLNNATQGD